MRESTTLHLEGGDALFLIPCKCSRYPSFDVPIRKRCETCASSVLAVSRQARCCGNHGLCKWTYTLNFSSRYDSRTHPYIPAHCPVRKQAEMSFLRMSRQTQSLVGLCVLAAVATVLVAPLITSSSSGSGSALDTFARGGQASSSDPSASSSWRPYPSKNETEEVRKLMWNEWQKCASPLLYRPVLRMCMWKIGVKLS